MNEIFIFNVAKLAVKSIINVASVFPKPGLITPLNNSALDGTDFPCLIDGAMSLFQCLVNCVSIGSDTEALKPEDAFTILRAPAKIGMNDSLNATRGKLSMKGCIFSMGLICSAAGRLISQQRFLTPQALALTASSYVENIVENELWGLENNTNGKFLTQGEKVYITYGIEGIRGEAEKGFKETLKAVELLRKLSATHGHLTLREKLVHTLINIMTENQDTSIAAQGGISELIKVQEEAKNVIDAGGMLSEKGIESVFEFDKNLRSKGIAPNGSAVILSTALFIQELGELKSTHSGYNE